MVGAAIVRSLHARGRNVLTVDRSSLDLHRMAEVEFWLRVNQPTAIIFAADDAGDSLINRTSPADLVYDNLIIQTNLIHAAHGANVDRLVLIGSSCVYPKLAQQPIQHNRRYISVVPCNLYGPPGQFRSWNFT